MTRAAGQPNEWSVELAPSSVRADKLAALKEIGVTRVSMGVQSFDDASLKALGRVHDAAQARAAVEEAAAAFDTFNLDIMYALPGQDLAALERDVREALAFAPPHISIYHLTIEPNTVFEDRVNQIDLRFAKLFRGSFGRVRASLDLYNAFNAATVLGRNQAFGLVGVGWGRPTALMGGRLIKLAAQYTWN